MLGQARVLGDDAPVDVRHLGHPPHAEHAAAGIPLGQGAARLQGDGRVSLHVEGLAQDEIRLAQRAVDVAAGDGVGGDRVRSFRLEEQRSPRLAGRPRVHERDEGVVVHLHVGERVLGLVAVLGHDGGHRLADVADLVTGQRTLQIAAHLAPLGHAHGDGAGQLRHVVEGDDVDDAGARARGGHVDGPDPRVRMRTPHHREVQGMRTLDVGDVGTAALQQPLVLASLETPADVAPQGYRSSASAPELGASGTAVRTNTATASTTAPITHRQEQREVAAGACGRRRARRAARRCRAG